MSLRLQKAASVNPLGFLHHPLNLTAYDCRVSSFFLNCSSKVTLCPGWLYEVGFSYSGLGNLRLAYGPTSLRRLVTPTPTTLFIICLLSCFNCFLTSIILPKVVSVRLMLLHVLSCSDELCPLDTCCMHTSQRWRQCFGAEMRRSRCNGKRVHLHGSMFVSYLALLGCLP